MCGRFSLITKPEKLKEIFNISVITNCQFEPPYNNLPTTKVATVLSNSESQQPECQLLHWRLIPSWSKDSRIGAKYTSPDCITLERDEN